MIHTANANKGIRERSLPSEDSISRARSIKIIRLMIWLYFAMIILSGVLRKWVFPAAQAPLLFVQDIFVFVIYTQCYKTGMIPRTPLFYSLLVLSILSLIAGFIVLPDSPLTVLYGFRSNFYHLPLLFVIPMVFNAQDVRKVGYVTLFCAIPITLLMIAQYQAPADAFVNKAAGLDSHQLSSALGHIRPAGPFSFTSGIPLYFSLVAIFLCDGFFVNKKYPMLLLLSALIASGIAVAVSGSRNAVASVVLVLLLAIIGGFLKPGSASKSMKLILVIFLAGVVLVQTPVFQDGYNTTATRTEQASENEGGIGNIIDERLLRNYTRPLELLDEVPLLGEGLGIGTFAGAAMLRNNASGSLFMIKGGDDLEMDLPRNIHESGPLLGSLFIVFRICVSCCIFWFGLQASRKGTLLPLLLGFMFQQSFTCAELGQTTDLTFCMLFGGLTIAASLGDEQFVQQNVSNLVALPTRIRRVRKLPALEEQ